MQQSEYRQNVRRKRLAFFLSQIHCFLSKKQNNKIKYNDYAKR